MFGEKSFTFSREKNDGIGINLGHYLNDCLWLCTQID